MAYGDLKDLAKRTVSDKILRYKAFNIAKNPKFDGYQHGLTSVVYNFLTKQLLVELPLLHGQRPYSRRP